MCADIFRVYDYYDIHHFAPNIRETPLHVQSTFHPSRIRGDVYGIDQLPRLVEQLRPRIFFFVHDLWFYSLLSPCLGKYKRVMKVVQYCAIDSRIVEPRLIRALSTLDKLVVYTEFAKSALHNCGKTAPEEEPDDWVKIRCYTNAQWRNLHACCWGHAATLCDQMGRQDAGCAGAAP